MVASSRADQDFGVDFSQSSAPANESTTRIANHVAAKRLEDAMNFNFARLRARARVIFVSSGPTETAQRMIDDNVGSAFHFAPDDPAPTAIIELAENAHLHRITALHKSANGRLEIYITDKLASDPEDLRGAKLVASVTEKDESGNAAIDFDPQGARFVALRWTPATATHEGFEVAEVGAFGEATVSFLSTMEAPDLYAETQSHVTGEGGVDFSNKLGTLADPPTIGQVSP